MRPSGVHIFDSSGSSAVDVDVLGRYCNELLGGVNVECHGDLLTECLSGFDRVKKERLKDAYAVRLAEARVANIKSVDKPDRPAKALVDYERRMLDRNPPRPIGILYDGYQLCLACAEPLEALGTWHEDCIIVITSQLFGSCEDVGSRYHARVSIYGNPCLLSTTGLVEAPARPRRYYLEKRMGIDPATLEKQFAGRFLDYEDSRTTDVLKGYIAQAIFYYMTGEPFCGDPDCRLYNAHWQEELLRAQLGGDREFCDYHQQLLQAVKGAGNG